MEILIDETLYLIMKTLHNVGIPSRLELKSGGLDYTVYLHEDNWKDASKIIYFSLPAGTHLEHKIVPDSVDRTVKAIYKYRDSLND